MSSPDASPLPARRRRRWPSVLALVALAIVGLIASAPLLLNSPAGNRAIFARLDRVFSPGRLRLDSVRVSWSGPTRLVGFRLEDPRGKAVVTAPTASLSSSLWDLATRPGRLGTLVLDGATFDVARRDGGIDLADALGSILANPDPRRDLTVRAEGAGLVVRDGTTPVVEGRTTLLVAIPASPSAVTWSVDVLHDQGGTIRVVGDLDRWRVRPTSAEVPDFTATLRATRWPLTGRLSEIDLAADLGGRARIARKANVLTVDGLADLASIRADGPGLKGDSVRLASLSVNASVGLKGGLWSLDQFEAKGPLGTIRGSMMSPDEPTRIGGTVDLAAIARQLPHVLGLREGLTVDRGTATLDVATRPGADPSEWAIEGKVGLDDLAWTVDGTTRVGAKSSIATRSVYRGDRRTLRVDAMTIATPYGSAEATGRVDAATVDLSGTISPDWSALSAMLAERVEPGAKLAGGPQRFHVKGPIAHPLDVEVGLSIVEADLFGMKVGPTPIVVHARGDAISVDPIDTTLNGGRLTLVPTIDLQAPGGPVIRLGRDSGLTGATVNEEVSRRVLSYVAPILDRTTRASGQVSVAIDEATFPLRRDVGNKAAVTGSVVFQDLQFSPGPLAHQVFGLVSAREPETIRLDEPVFLTIADGRINQRGLAFPLGDVTRVGIEGWVDFEKNVGLVASLPITPAMFPNRPMLGEIVAGTSIKVPITGTLASPKLDKSALNANLKDLGASLLTRAAGRGALELLNNLARPRPRDPDAPPPPTAMERKAQRIEKQNERRAKRGLPPLPVPMGREGSRPVPRSATMDLNSGGGSRPTRREPWETDRDGAGCPGDERGSG